MARNKITLIWHEAGNPHYHERFTALEKIFEIEVLGPSQFQGVKFEKGQTSFRLLLFRSLFTFHWLTYVSLSLIWFLVRTNSDILYIHEEPHSITAFLAVLFRGRKTVVIESSVINLKGNLSGWNVLEKYVYAKVDKLLPKNYEVREILIKRGASAHKIGAPIGNGVDGSSFHSIPRTVAQEALLEKHREVRKITCNEVFVVGYAGRIWTSKGLDVFRELEKIDGIECIVCGPVIDAKLAERLASDGVTVLPSLGREDLVLFYNSLDLFILPSLNTPNWREQFGRVCAEAIFCGTPAIGSDVGGIPMVVGRQSTFEPGNTEQVTEMVKALRRERKLDALAETQKRRIRKMFSWDAIAHQIEDVCRSVLATRQRG
jgi:glycosyltransferase involved in cell wall biosynthesis